MTIGKVVHSVSPGAGRPLVPHHVSGHVVGGWCGSCKGHPETLCMHALILLDLNTQEHCFEDTKIERRVVDGWDWITANNGKGCPEAFY